MCVCVSECVCVCVCVCVCTCLEWAGSQGASGAGPFSSPQCFSESVTDSSSNSQLSLKL